MTATAGSCLVVLGLEGGDLKAVGVNLGEISLPVEGGQDDADKVLVKSLPVDLRPEIHVRRLHGYLGVGVVPSKDPEALLVLDAGRTMGFMVPIT